MQTKIYKSGICFTLCLSLLLACILSPLLKPEMKKVNAVATEFAIGIALEDALCLLLGACGIAVTGDVLIDDKKREKVAESFNTYQTQQNANTEALAEWTNNLCYGAVDTAGEIWDNFVDWACDGCQYVTGGDFILENGGIDLINYIKSNSPTEATAVLSGNNYTISLDWSTYVNSYPSGAIQGVWIGNARQNTGYNGIVVPMAIILSSGYIATSTAVFNYGGVFQSNLTSSFSGNYTYSDYFTASRWANTYSCLLSPSYNGLTDTQKADWSTHALTTSLAIVGANVASNLRDGKTKIFNKIKGVTDDILDFGDMVGVGTIDGATANRYKVQDKYWEKLQSLSDAIAQALALGMSQAIAIKKLIALVNELTNSITGIKDGTGVYEISADDTTNEVKPDDDKPINEEDFSINYAPDIDFTKFFPFCIPWDLYSLIKLFNAEPVAPKFDIPIKVSTGTLASGKLKIDETITIDLSPYDNVAFIFRIMMFLLVILGLILLTRNIIRG